MNKVIKSVTDWIKNIWTKGMEVFKSKGLPISVTVVNLLKEAVESGAGDFLVNLTKTNLDNQVLIWLKDNIGKISLELATTEVIINAGATDTEIVDALIAWLAKQNLSVKATFYAGFAAKINEYLADGKLSFAEALSLGQYLYKEISK